MPTFKNALLRYKTIDQCLCNRTQRWTLDDLINKCNEAMIDYCGLGISRRTIQMDIQFMRNDTPGYNAPIIVVEKKYYTYSDPTYSITKVPINAQDLQQLSEAVNLIKQLSGFNAFSGMEDIISRLEDHISYMRTSHAPVIYLEKNDNLQGLQYIPILHQAILEKQALRIVYKSFRSRREHTFDFSPYILKEYRNRWFVFGRHPKQQMLLNLALDRIIVIKKTPNLTYISDPDFHPETYFNDIVGVTRENTQRQSILFWASPAEAPYILTKPFHHSQRVVETHPDGSITFSLYLIINRELIRDFLGYAEGIRILTPQSLVETMKNKYTQALSHYNPIKSNKS